MQIPRHALNYYRYGLVSIRPTTRAARLKIRITLSRTVIFTRPPSCALGSIKVLQDFGFRNPQNGCCFCDIKEPARFISFCICEHEGMVCPRSIIDMMKDLVPVGPNLAAPIPLHKGVPQIFDTKGLNGQHCSDLSPLLRGPISRKPELGMFLARHRGLKSKSLQMFEDLCL